MIRGDAPELSSVGAEMVDAALEPSELLELFAGMLDGACVVEAPPSDAPEGDYRFVVANAGFGAMIGVGDLRGRSCRHVWPTFDARLRLTFGRVAATGTPERFVADHASGGTERKIDGYVYRLGGAERHRLAIQLTDVTRQIELDRELRTRLDHVLTVIEHAPMGVFLVDEQFRLLHVNAQARAGSREDAAASIGVDLEVLLRRGGSNATIDAVVREFRHTLATGESFREEALATFRDDLGTTTYTDWRIDRIRLPDGFHAVVCYFSDVTARIEAQQKLAASEAKYRTLYESMDQGLSILELEIVAGRAVAARFVETNPAFDRQTGFQHAGGRDFSDLNPDVEPFWLEILGEIATSGDARRFVEYSPSMDRWYDTFAFRIGEPHEHRVAALFTDVTDRKRADAALQESLATLAHHAHHDHLTGLPNRLLFQDRVETALVEAERHDRVLALLYIDLDGFKGVNDAHGHACGDAAIVEVARRLRSVVRASDTVTRLHGDEFAALLPGIERPEDAEALAMAMLTALAEPIVVGRAQVTLTASIGVAVFPRDGGDFDRLLRIADEAMYGAKLAGPNRIAYAR